jgi:hypothetical protein
LQAPFKEKEIDEKQQKKKDVGSKNKRRITSVGGWLAS